MKKISWVLFIIYFGIFALGGLLFYYKYLREHFFSGAEPLSQETASAPEEIYYSQENNLYRVNPALEIDPAASERVERFQSTGEVQNLDILKTGLKIAYDAKNSNGFSEIWQVDNLTLQSAKIAFQGLEGLEGFSDFQKPKYSPKSTKLAFLGLSAENEAIFIKDLATGTVSKLKKETSKIADYSWSEDSQKIIYCSSNLLENACWEIELSSGSPRKVLEGDVSQISWDKTSEVIFLKKEDQSANIYSLKIEGEEPKKISDLKAPKKVGLFRLDLEGQKIAYEVREDSIANIYYSEIDGTEIFQLTTDGRVSQPLFSPNSQEVGFVRQKDGLYLIKIDKTKERKIVNLDDKTVQLLLWSR